MSMVSSWDEVVTHLRSTQRDVATFPGDRLRFSAVHDGATIAFGGQRLASASGAPWIAFATKLGPKEMLRERSALVENVTLPIGGIAILLDQAVLRQTLPLPVSADAIAQTIAALAAFSAELRAAAAVQNADLDVEYAYLFH